VEGTPSTTTGFYGYVGLLPIRMEPTELDKVDTLTADGRGRVTLGAEFADENVKVYVERVEDE